ncbi:hypothetical protein D3C78_943480 [compost metagenome]
MFNDLQLNADELQKSYSIDEDANGTTDYTVQNPNFSFAQFRSNLVVRWEYIPGSEFYLVWSQGITANGSPDNNLFDELNTQLLNGKTENIFLLKMTYRLTKHIRHKQ